MSAERALFEAYREWRRLARAGSKAICRRDWKLLLECQSIAQRIQPSISNLSRQAREEWRQSNVDSTDKEKKLRAMMFELKDLLESNQKLLQTARTTALARRQKLEQAGRNLKRLQTSYAFSRQPAWTSFS
jgi:hypothetical protein